MNAVSRICQLSNYTQATSELTGRSIYINESLDQYLVSPEWQQPYVKKVTQQWVVRIETLNAERRPPPSLRRAVIALGDCVNRDEFAVALDVVLLAEFKDRLTNSSVGINQPFLIELMLALWSVNAIAWPAKIQEPFSNFYLFMKNAGWIGPQKEFLSKIQNFLNKGGTDDSTNFRFILDHIFSRSGIVEIGDLTPTTFYLTKDRTRTNKMRSLGVLGVLHILRETYPKQSINWTAENFGFFLVKRGHLGRDENFNWLLSKAPDMGDWVKLVKEHLEISPANFGKRKSALNQFMTHFLENPSITRNPAGYFDIRKRPDVLFDVPGSKGRQAMGVINEFLNEVLIKTCTQCDDNEVPILMPGFANPLPKLSYKGCNKGETHRETMPTRLIRLAISILTENDFAWAKQAGRIKDHFRWKNPNTNEFETLWSPVRAYALLIKLLLPARTFQVRHIDSGEGDTYRYEVGGQWVLNQGLHRPVTAKTVECGIFRKYKRKDGSEGAVLFFNTNKTADINSQTRGFVMPWEKLDALKIFAELRNWQEIFNPVTAPTAWADIRELKGIKHGDDLNKMGTNFFLFRDPCNSYRPDLPITDVRIRNLWLKLNEEMEKRLAAAGETLLSGDPIRLILSRDKQRQVSAAVFDLHSLRVTLITAMYEEGVPPEILMKIVGHATILMTLYYTKVNAETLSFRMDEALLARQKKSQSEMAGFIQKASRQELERAVAFTNPSALDAITGSSGAGMIVMDHGICPVGAKRCNEGLAVIDAAADFAKYQPVPSGAGNCVRCRFFITGPAFLFGLEAHVDDLAYRLKKSSFSFERAQERFDAISDNHAEALEIGQPFHRQRELEIAEIAFEVATAEVDSIALSLQSAYALTEQCIRINNHPAANESGLSLVAVGGTEQIEAVLSECHEFEQLNRICLSATFFDGLKISWQQPNLERARLFDRMLRASGHEPRFSLLNDDDALNIANAMGQFLYARLNKDTVHDLVDGRTTLRAIGLEKAFVEQLKIIEPKRLSIASASKLLEH